jgi:hypothetical protein
MELKIVDLKLIGDTLPARDVPKVRGYIAGKYPEYVELHNHMGDSRFKYSYPVIQYKAVCNVPHIVGINDGADVLIEVGRDVGNIDIKKDILNVEKKVIEIRNCYLGESEEMIKYNLISPWAALNQENFRKFQDARSYCEKVDILKSVFTGNILSLCKAFGYTVQERLNVVFDIYPVKVNLKGNILTAFKGSFEVNFSIPDLLGIGKSVSRGFGTIVKTAK